MHKYFKSVEKSTSSSDLCINDDELQLSNKRSRHEIDMSNLPADPYLRIRISDYPIEHRDVIRRYYLLKGPNQPRNHIFPKTTFGQKERKFNAAWFEQFPSWLEYSIEKDAAFCLFCYLFKPAMGQQSGGDVFVTEGFRKWKDAVSKFKEHIGGPNSIHNEASMKCNFLLNSKQHIEVSFQKQTDQNKKDYRHRLTATIDCIEFLIRQGLAFRGNDESEKSSNQGNFLELLRFLGDHNKEIKQVILENAHENNKLTAPDIQKDIINAMASETLNLIIRDIGDSFFVVLIDESRDISTKEQMAIAVRYVDRQGQVIERFLGIVHVSDTSSISLKGALEEFFANHGLCISKLRGQGYDGASNMRGEFNGLKTLILKENSSAYYIHCFAHQLQLALVAVAKNHILVDWFFDLTATTTNIITASCKRQDLFRESQSQKIFERLQKGDITSGTGQNQERNLIRAGDTRWSSHYSSLISMIVLFPSVIDVLELVEQDQHTSSEQKATTFALLNSLQTFDYVFILYLMRDILGIIDILSQTLQRKEQDIANAINLVRISKQRLQDM